MTITRADLQGKVRERKAGNVLLFLVDASSSMGTQQRILATQGAILSLLVDAYQRRDRVGLVTFRESFAEIILRPTSSIEKAKRAFEGILLGGTTPLSAGLVAAVDLLETELRKNRDLMPLLILITDGMPNVSLG
ncbi:MAG TPA: VWA domain-containing protein, partial [Candidatus Methylomirabilis sp.]|nr:VWA domain-containing protein [Candidatus Methylomirabilis sp.]